jgi:hypothetical protein
MSDRSPGPPDTGPGEDPQDRTDERERYSCAEACETVEGGRAPARDYRVSARRFGITLRTDHAMS